MNPRALLAILAATSMLSACGSYKGDLEKICNAPELSGNKDASNFADVGPWLENNIRTRKGRAFLQSLASSGSIDVARIEIRANGLTVCPLLDAHPVNGTGVQLLPTKIDEPNSP